MVGAQFRTVRVVIGHGVRVEELVHAIPVTPVDDFVQVHPMLAHLGLSRGKTGGDFCTLLLRQNEVGRSEEHTSELQSLMRISCAVFCLSTKTTKTPQTQTQQNKASQCNNHTNS